MLRTASVGILILASGCSGPAPSEAARPSPADDLTRLVVALEGQGAQVRDLGGFSPGPEVLGNSGRTLCVGDQKVLVYGYSLPSEAESVAGKFDREDPSHVGPAVIEWVSHPRFWQGDSLLVQYAGPDAGTEAVLTAVLGSPFARGGGRETAAASFTC